MTASRPIRIEGDHAVVPLTRGMVAIIDIIDITAVAAETWRAVPARSGGGWYAKSGRDVFLHRFLYPAVPGLVRDHIDGDGLNCRRANMRDVTRRRSAQNRDVRSDNTAGLKGVKILDNGTFQARITVDGVRMSLGAFKSDGEAHEAYQKAAAQHFGAFARVIHRQVPGDVPGDKPVREQT